MGSALIQSHRPSPQRSRLRIMLAAALVLLCSCTGNLPSVPPQESAGQRHPGKVVWHDLITSNVQAARAFYGGLLGWEFTEVTAGYLVASRNNTPVAGLAQLTRKDRRGYWLPLLSTADIESTGEAMTLAGADRLLKPFFIRGRGTVAVFRDPQGAVFGLVESERGDPGDGAATPGRWLWHEIWTDDLPASAGFYSQTMGYRLRTTQISDTPYQYLEHDGRPRVGLLTKPDQRIDNTWVAYLLVSDLDAAVQRVPELGGTVLMAPRTDVRKGTVAVVRDPDGAGFILQEAGL